MRKYFVYELKTRAPAIGILAVAALALYLVPIASADYRISMPAPLWIISTVGGVLAAGVPVWLLAYKMKRRSCDLYYALPLSRIKLLSVRMLIGLVAVFAPYTASYWIGAALIFARFGNLLNGVVFVYQYFASIIPILIIYLISAFVFTRANRFIDGIVFMIFWAFVVIIVCEIVNGLYFFDFYIDGLALAPFGPIDRVTAHFQRTVVQYYISSDGTLQPLKNTLSDGWNFDLWETVGLIFNTLLAAAAGVGLFLTETRHKTENAGQISDSPYGYKTMIPIYTALILSAFDFSYSPFFAVAVVFLVAVFALTAVYRRTIRIGKRQAIIFASSVAVGILLNLVCNSYF